jgi:ribonuclease BN (tRNA processing enzyme)
LVDSGAASCFGAHLGSVLSNLKASGYKPEQVDSILLTHLHPDHVCGISKDGKRIFLMPQCMYHKMKQLLVRSKTSRENSQEKRAGYLSTVEKSSGFSTLSSQTTL